MSHPLLQIIAHCRNDWSVLTCTLYARCRLEKRERRRVERALLQCEELVGSYAKLAGDDVNNATVPVPFLYEVGQSLSVCHQLQVQSLHAEILTSFGCVTEALAVYMSIDDVEAVIECYRLLNKMDAAESLIRSRLDTDPVTFLCLLGDITDNAEQSYEKAMQVCSLLSLIRHL